MTVCLTAIMRDEQDTIGRLVDSVRPHITTYCLIDTGSTDNTINAAREALAGLDGVIEQREWVNFGVNRTQLMQLAHGKADWLLLADCDMQIVHDGPLPELTADVYEGTIRQGPIEYTLPILVKGDRNWRYEGVAHSYLACDGPHTSQVLAGLTIIDGSSTGPEKLRRDLELLSAEHAKNPLDARTAFYLAQTYYDLDMIPEAIAAYRYRAHLNGWDEETFYARYRLGALLCEHVSFAQGAPELLAAWEMRPQRIEPLRVLANVANNVADKQPMPPDRLFVGHRHYKQPDPPATVMPPTPQIAPTVKRNRKKTISAADVSAIVVTRGNVDLQPILASLPYDDVVVWDNSQREHDYKVFGRYAAIPEAKNPVVYWQDDDIVFTGHDELLAAYQPGRIVANMDQAWIDGAGYGDFLAMVGAGSLCDSHLPAQTFARYFAAGYEWDEDVLLEADFLFGTMTPFQRVDLGYQVRDFADDPDRLYRQPGQTERKHRIIGRGRDLVAA